MLVQQQTTSRCFIDARFLIIINDEKGVFRVVQANDFHAGVVWHECMPEL